ncbi:helicase [Phragmitibacter flavus]|uniref:Helicase n=1 Tax=Phragmitibacter flavus TaxID=2576071 RepID=A0A5R8KH48_9BACT|nr:ribonuclease H-like domain-containing protein [Phragmitibacter flavus]TLD71636.1 helicase [Phragmitibacter flavus]
MPRDIVYFDLETQRTANDVGGWQNKHQMGVSVGCTFSTKTGQYHIFTEQTVKELIDQLLRADLVVGFNHVSFDYSVLAGYYPFDLAEQLRSLDILVEVEKKIGHRLKLEALASATLGAGKTADGLDAIRWWQQGKVAEIAEYCCYDVKVTKCLYEHGVEYGEVRYLDRNHREQVVAVEWSL